MELRGAALSTVIARGGAMVGALLILHFRDRLLDYRTPSLRDVWNSWKQIAYIAIPATATNILEPLGLAIVTWIIALQGPAAVAAWGAGSRVTAFSLIPVFALCSGLVPFVGQNWGAEKFSRVLKARKYGHRFAFAWGILVAVALHFVANPVASLFSTEPEVVTEIVRYLWIIPIGYALVGIFSVTEETLNAIGKPIIATVSTLIHMFAFYVPFAFAGSYFYGIVGLLAGLALADILGGLVGLSLSRLMCRRGEKDCLPAAQEKEAV
jgi:Na+-driven multidrug efflux pump